MIDSFPSRVLAQVRKQGLDSWLLEEPLVVGVSGGADSLALLHVLVALRGEQASSTLHVAHVDHGLRGDEARADAQVVRQLAAGLSLQFTEWQVDVPGFVASHGLSVEDAARRLRYACLGELAREQGASVATAHTADDQSETVLMNILRGTGLAGLKGMSMLAPVPLSPDDRPAGSEPVRLFRPLLGIWRAEIEDYCTRVGLQPRIDSSNADRSYTRNRIRRELLPLLEREYSAGIKAHLANLAEIASAENELVDNLLKPQLEQLVRLEPGGKSICFLRAEVAALPVAARRRIVRGALGLLAGTLENFSFKQVEAVCTVLSGEPGSAGAVELPHGLIVERTGEQAMLRFSTEIDDEPLLADYEVRPLLDPMQELTVVPGESTALRGGWKLTACIRDKDDNPPTAGEWVALFDAGSSLLSAPLLMRARQSGETIRPLGMSGSRSLQDLYIDAKIPKRIRSALPVLISPLLPGEVLWVPGPGGRRSRHATIGSETERLLQIEFSRTGA